MKKLLAWLGLPVLMAACSQGYSTEEESLNLHLQMTQAETMTALNTIGMRAHLDQVWRYQLRPGCRLEVTSQGGLFPRAPKTGPLQQAEVSMIKDEGSDAYPVILTPLHPAAEAAITVLGEGTWRDASQVKWLLNYLLKFCVSGQTANDRYGA